MDISTPALLLDLKKVRRNTKAMTARLASKGVNLRPHLKTAKSLEVARLAIEGNFGGITVSTLTEAEFFFAQGITDIVYAVCIAPSKLDRAADLTRRGAGLKIIIDSVDLAVAISGHGGQFRVLIEIDCGEHRTGLDPDHADLLEIARLITDSENAELSGVLTHAGQSYNCRSVQDIRQTAQIEHDAVLLAAARIKKAGYACPVVSIGSTPTVTFGDDFSGVTEARPGVFVFYDLFQAGMGVCSEKDIALSVLASVISNRPEHQQVLIDAGGLALSKDRSTGALDTDFGYGLVCDALTGLPESGLIVDSVHQEHGNIHISDVDTLAQFPVGRRVRILPNHACMTAAAYDGYYVVDGNDIVAEWPRCNGWK